MPFSQPGDFTVGVEEEYQLVSAQTGDLRSRARHVLEADWSEEIQPEVYETTLEMGTRVCGSAAELDQEIRRMRLQAAAAAATQDLRLVAAGLHPFSRWHGHIPSAGERYARILERFGRVVRTEHVFGMHTHVAVGPEQDRLALMSRVRWFTPHLLALSSSSPVYESELTGFASYRNILWRRMPLSGPVPAVETEADYQKLVEVLIRSGAALDNATIYWSIRPHPRYPTIEFRIADVCPRAEDAVAISVFARVLVAAAAEGRLAPPASGLGGGADAALLASNEWIAARYGLDAVLTDPATGDGVPLRDSLRRLIDELHPLSQALGDGDALAGVEQILERGNGADRIREVIASWEDLGPLVDWLAGESLLGTGMDRRSEQRVEVDAGAGGAA